MPILLTPEQVRHARQILDAADWVDGRVTAGHQSARAKDNMQLPEGSPAARELGDMVLGALGQSPLFISAALPLQVFPPLFNRYSGGQSFGTHVDNAIRQVTGGGQRIRTDISATLFFTNPDEYEGGELVVEDTYGAQSIKLPAGHMILYPATSLHHVRPVTQGRARRLLLLDSKHGARRRPPHHALRSGRRDPAAQRRSPRSSVGRATHRRLSQPAAAVGGGLMIRKIFFWLHLAAGSLAGIVILIMSITGVLLAWQRQIIHYADRQFRQPAAVAQAARATPEALLAKVVEARHALPTTLTLRADPAEPASAEFGRNAVVYLHPATGQVLGEGSTAVRAFFRETENWHRWLAVGLESRATARGVTGACNLLFLGLLLSGFYLWLPRIWSRQYLRPPPGSGADCNGKARDWNWHNTIGIWCVAPLFVIVASAVVMSYPWANNLVYRVTGSELPQPNGGGGGGRGGRRARRQPANAARRSPSPASIPPGSAPRRRFPRWKSIALRVPANARAPLVFSIDSGDGGRPDLRAQLTLKRGSGDLVKWEPFSANNAGRRLRSWIRFSHTGEAGGIPGETHRRHRVSGRLLSRLDRHLSRHTPPVGSHRPPPQRQSGRRTCRPLIAAMPTAMRPNPICDQDAIPPAPRRNPSRDREGA